jgi:hypothetical protein
MTMVSTAFGESQASFIFSNGPKESLAQLTGESVRSNPILSKALRAAAAGGFNRLQSNWGSLRYGDIQILTVDPKLNTRFNRRFLTTLASEKSKLMMIYGLQNREYNRLALMAFGVLGRETKFAQSPKYFFKEHFQLVVSTAKRIEAIEHGVDYHFINSRGPTQIKRLPSKIAENYSFDINHLGIPENAAVATLGFLAECLSETKTRARVRKLDFINQENIYDYILYSYFGSTRQLISRTATPTENIYIKTVKGYIHGVVLLETDYEKLTQIN